MRLRTKSNACIAASARSGRSSTRAPMARAPIINPFQSVSILSSRIGRSRRLRASSRIDRICSHVGCWGERSKPDASDGSGAPSLKYRTLLPAGVC